MAPRTRPDVQHPPSDELERSPFLLQPVVVVGEEPLGAHGRPDVAVVALENGLSGPPFEVVEEQEPKGVLVAPEDAGYAASDVRRPSSAAMGRIAATTLRMWSSSSTPSSSAPL